MDLSKTIYFDSQKDGLGEDYFFCGDDLYRHYTSEELINLRSAIWCRITEVLIHKYKYGEK